MYMKNFYFGIHLDMIDNGCLLSEVLSSVDADLTSSRRSAVDALLKTGLEILTGCRGD